MIFISDRRSFSYTFIVATVNLQLTQHECTFFLKKRGLTVDSLWTDSGLSINDANGTTKNYYNVAIAYNKKDALQGYYSDIVMDFSKVILSDGTLLSAENPMATRTVDGIAFSWENDSSAWENGVDQAMLMAYFPTSETVECRLYGSKRSEGHELMTLQDRLMEEPAHVYIFFVSPDRSEVSKSSYLGEI